MTSRTLPVIGVATTVPVRDIGGDQRPAGEHLCQSIVEHGLLHPIHVRPNPAWGDPSDPATPLLVVHGARRLDACRRLKIEWVEVMVVAVTAADADRRWIAENFARHHSSTVDVIRVANRLLAEGDALADIAARFRFTTIQLRRMLGL